MVKFSFTTIDKDEKLKDMLLPFCRFNNGDIWEDPEGKHKIACIDAADNAAI